jgi:hypothetical protein
MVGMQAIIDEELMMRKTVQHRRDYNIAAMQRAFEAQLPALVTEPRSATLQ